jgi:hypothetical protein
MFSIGPTLGYIRRYNESNLANLKNKTSVTTFKMEAASWWQFQWKSFGEHAKIFWEIPILEVSFRDSSISMYRQVGRKVAPSYGIRTNIYLTVVLIFVPVDCPYLYSISADNAVC